jgi:PEP-CTERM motif
MAGDTLTFQLVPAEATMTISPSRIETSLPWIRGAVLVCLVALQPTVSSAVPLVTSNPADVATFQTGATVENFDDLSALAVTSYAAQAVPEANRFSSRNLVAFTSPFFNSGGASFNDPVLNPGTPIGILAPGDGIAGDVKSPGNVAGGLAGDGSFEAFNNGFIEVIFPADVSKVGLWVTQGSIKLLLKDANNTNLATGDVEVSGTAGQFIGIERATADVRGVTIGFTQALTIDDFTYSASAPVPEPSSGLLIAMGLTGLLGWRRIRLSSFRQR